MFIDGTCMCDIYEKCPIYTYRSKAVLETLFKVCGRGGGRRREKFIHYSL